MERACRIKPNKDMRPWQTPGPFCVSSLGPPLCFGRSRCPDGEEAEAAEEDDNDNNNDDNPPEETGIRAFKFRHKGDLLFKWAYLKQEEEKEKEEDDNDDQDDPPEETGIRTFHFWHTVTLPF
ncbi:MAG: hypothetical protein HPY58_06210 [Firmicutes bacterium]|nr:hypothetical protein [Bacillota bacterium]